MTYGKANKNDIPLLVELRIKYLLEDYGNLSEDKLTTITNNLYPYFEAHLNKDLFVFVCKDAKLLLFVCV